jgi:hypothetical protein
VPEPLSDDTRELLDALNRWEVEYLVIGAHAVGVYAEPRGTQDLDIWVNPTRRNAKRALGALREFGAPLFGATEKSLINKEDFLIIGVSPNRIDVLKSIPGLEFRAAWRKRRTLDVGGTTAHFPSPEDVLTAKLAAGRPQDLLDVAKLRKALEVERRRSEVGGSSIDETTPDPGRSPRRRDRRGSRRGQEKDRGPGTGPNSGP